MLLRALHTRGVLVAVDASVALNVLRLLEEVCHFNSVNRKGKLLFELLHLLSRRTAEIYVQRGR